MLKKDGLLVIQVPNYSSVMARICGKYWDWWSVPDHLYHMNYASLSILLDKHNFQIITAYSWEAGDDFVNNIAGSLRKRIPKFLSINRILSRLFVPFIYIILFIVRITERFYYAGGLITVYAKKR